MGGGGGIALTKGGVAERRKETARSTGGVSERKTRDLRAEEGRSSARECDGASGAPFYTTNERALADERRKKQLVILLVPRRVLQEGAEHLGAGLW